MEFFIDLMTNGLLVGLMYALVAVGFVLIYKATSIINFAQGDLVMFAGYAAAVMALVFLIAFGLFFTLSRLGIAMRAVADDQQAAMVVGIRVSRVFALSWAIAGLAAAAGGVIWGNMLGASSLLSLVGLKVFPVVILGGLDSIGGGLFGGVILGAVESVTAGYLDPYVGGGTQDFIPYV